MKKLSTDIKTDTEPTLQNFFKFCEKYYGRKVHCGELWFNTYYLSSPGHNKVKSNPALFCRLSEKYFKEIHQVDNPIKDGKSGIKHLLAVQWTHNKYGVSTAENMAKTLNEDKEFNAMYDEAWNDIIVDGDFRKLNALHKGEYDYFKK